MEIPILTSQTKTIFHNINFQQEAHGMKMIQILQQLGEESESTLKLVPYLPMTLLILQVLEKLVMEQLIMTKYLMEPLSDAKLQITQMVKLKSTCKELDIQ